MANRNFNRFQVLEHEVKRLYLETAYTALVQASGTLNLTDDIVLTKVAGGAANNSYTFTTEVLAAAANPTDTVLVAFTGTAAAIVCTVTPNDGTNNSATPVDLTTAELVELINSGAVVGKNVTVTDASSLRNDQTATGGGATALVEAGEGDHVIATFAGGVNQAFTLIANQLKWGIKSIVESAPGTFRITLSDKYSSLKYLNGVVKAASAADLNVQIKAEDVNGAVPYIDIYTLTGATPTNPVTGASFKISIDLKNTDII